MTPPAVKTCYVGGAFAARRGPSASGGRALGKVLSTDRFTTADAAELYGVPYWSNGYFHIGQDGRLRVTLRDEDASVALLEIIDDLKRNERTLPLILRFPQLLENRLTRLNDAFNEAILKYER